MRSALEAALSNIDAAAMVAMAPAPARPLADRLARQIAADRAAIRTAVAQVRERRAWIAAAAAHNPGVGRFYSDGAAEAGRMIAAKRRSIRVNARRLRDLRADAQRKAA